MGYILTEEDFNQYYEEVMNETKDVSFVTHYMDELAHIKNRDIKITMDVTKKLFPNDVGKEGRTFHMGQVDGKKGIDSFKKTVKNKLPVSSFTFFGSYLPSMQGVQTSGGIIYELFGQILYRGNRDIMSVPDNRGARWLYSSRVFPPSVVSEFRDEIETFLKTNRVPNKPSPHADIKDPEVIYYLRYIRTYIGICQSYIDKYTDVIKNYISSEETSEWDEILIQNYRVNDVIWTTQNIYSSGEYSWVSDFNRLVKKDMLNADEKMLFKELHAKYRAVVDKIESFIEGEVTYAPDKKLAMNWVREHGGFHRKEDYMKDKRSGGDVSETSDYLYTEQKQMKKKIKITEEQLKRLMEVNQLDERRHTYIEPKEVSEEEIEENDDMSVTPPDEIEEKMDLPKPPSEEEEKNNQVYESIRRDFKRFL